MYLQITERCNMSCNHCCMSATSKGKDMSMKIFKKACEIASEHGQTISLGGGEPTLHPKFKEMVGIALFHCEDIPFIATNGSITDISLSLANLARRGVLFVALSRDVYHDEIDDEVVRAFSVSRHERSNDDCREIRDVTDREKAVGRAFNWGIPGCVCAELFVDPEGNIWACGCKTVSFGTVWSPKIDFDPEWSDYNCPEDFKRFAKENS